MKLFFLTISLVLSGLPAYSQDAVSFDAKAFKKLDPNPPGVESIGNSPFLMEFNFSRKIAIVYSYENKTNSNQIAQFIADQPAQSMSADSDTTSELLVKIQTKQDADLVYSNTVT